MVCREGHSEAAASIATQLQGALHDVPTFSARHSGDTARLDPLAEAKVLQQLRWEHAKHNVPMAVQRVCCESTRGDAALWG